MSVFLFIFLWLISLSNTSLAQLPETLNFNHLTQQDGLSQSSGQAIYQDSQGYMWFGTSNGLNKYNGYDMTVYMHDPIDSTTI
ncbi:MAG: two-component regulator propeller domain-containing protein, partial [Balneolaceae bacterium]